MTHTPSRTVALALVLLPFGTAAAVLVTSFWYGASLRELQHHMLVVGAYLGIWSALLYVATRPVLSLEIGARGVSALQPSFRWKGAGVGMRRVTLDWRDVTLSRSGPTLIAAANGRRIAIPLYVFDDPRALVTTIETARAAGSWSEPPWH